MVIIRMVLLHVCVLTSTFAACQQQPTPDKQSPNVAKLPKERGNQMGNAVGEAKKPPEQRFGYLKCRADAQMWTSDPFDTKDERNRFGGTAIMVNGQFRSRPESTPHVAVAGLMERVHEMEVCTQEDADFEKQFATYSSLSKAYDEEICFRYDGFLMRHNLREQFFKEDAIENK